jgi:hypothetical protein
MSYLNHYSAELRAKSLLREYRQEAYLWAQAVEAGQVKARISGARSLVDRVRLVLGRRLRSQSPTVSPASASSDLRCDSCSAN